MSLRVIGGQWKGRRLQAPPGLATRPLPDRIKQSLFDWLGQALDGLRVADVCAGSGSFGIESASRGAAEVVLIDPGPQAQPILRANLQAVGQPPAIRVVPRPFQDALPHLPTFDLIFADPPFPWFREHPDLLAQLLACARDALNDQGRLIIRGERGEALPAPPIGLVERERRQYGRSWVAMFERSAPE